MSSHHKETPSHLISLDNKRKLCLWRKWMHIRGVGGGHSVWKSLNCNISETFFKDPERSACELLRWFFGEGETRFILVSHFLFLSVYFLLRDPDMDDLFWTNFLRFLSLTVFCTENGCWLWNFFDSGLFPFLGKNWMIFAFWCCCCYCWFVEFVCVW